MQSQARHWSVEELLGQAEWLGGLARRLVRDESQAEDLVQETWTRALEAPPERDRPLRPWLGTVLRNLVRMRGRSEAARSAREVQQVHRRELPGPDALAERLEGQRMLMDALFRLRQPYREIVLLAYFEHLSSEQIAQRLGVPPGTVRWRLKAGLDTLRAELNAKHGGRERWMPALSPLVQLDMASHSAALAVAGQGVLWMSLIAKWALGALAVFGLVGLITFSLKTDDPRMEELVRADVQASAHVLETDGDAAARDRVASDSAAEIAKDRLPTDSEPAPAPAASAPRTSVEALVVDEAGQAVHAAFLSSFNKEVQGVADAAGRVRVEWNPHDAQGLVGWRIWAEGRESRLIEDGYVRGQHRDLGTVVLGPGGAAEGRVVHSDGRPASGALVVQDLMNIPVAERRMEWGEPVSLGNGIHARTDENGGFRLEGLKQGMQIVRAGTAGYPVAGSELFEVRAGETVRGLLITIPELDPQAYISGVVRLPDGTPAPCARVAVLRDGGKYLSRWFDCDSKGAFRVPDSGTDRLTLRASEMSRRFGALEINDVRPGTHGLVLQLTELPKLWVRARDEAGVPVDGFQVTVRRSHGDSQTTVWKAPRDAEPKRASPPLGGLAKALKARAAPVPSTGTAEQAEHVEHVELYRRGLDPAKYHAEYSQGRLLVSTEAVILSSEHSEYWITVDAAGYEKVELGPFRDLPAEDVEVTLKRTSSLKGRVALADGQPLAGATVRVYSAEPVEELMHGFPLRFSPKCLAAAMSRADGSFELSVYQDGDLVILALSGEHATEERFLSNYSAAAGCSDLEIRLNSGGAIEGRVEPEKAEPEKGLFVAFSRGDGLMFTVIPDREGRFRADRLTPGRWELRLRDYPILSEFRILVKEPPTPPAAVLEVREGETARVVLFTQEAKAAPESDSRLKLSVSIDGLPAQGFNASLRSLSPGALAVIPVAGNLDANGCLELSSKLTGPVELLLTAIGGELDGLRIQRHFEWTEKLCILDLSFSTARVRVLNPTGSLGLVTRVADGCHALMPVRGEQDCRVLTGELKLCRTGPRPVLVNPFWPVIAQTTVTPGSLVELDASP